MLVLDENLPASQRQLLLKWRIHFRMIGVDVAARGTDDEILISAFHHLPQPTFFSLDNDFYRRDWVHASYCLVWLDVRRRDAAVFIRRFLRHPSFDTQNKRMGNVVRVHSHGITFWRGRQRAPDSVAWPAQ